MDIQIKHGLDIPLEGKGEGEIQDLPLPNLVALDLSPFETLRFTLLKKVGESVQGGEPLAEDKSCPGRTFVAPAAGTIKEIVRGLKRRILSIVIETDSNQNFVKHEPLQKDEVIPFLMKGGFLPHIRMRPCNRIAHPDQRPQVIFIQAIESAPYAPSPELHLEGREEAFTEGLKLLSRLCPVHLVYRKGSACSSFTQAPHVEKHTADGPHPIGNPSVHIAALSPILRNDQVIWTLDVPTVIAVGIFAMKGVYDPSIVITLSGEEKRGVYRVNRGIQVKALLQDKEGVRIISGDPLTGAQVTHEGFLGFYHHAICTLSEGSLKREFLHFLKGFRKGYTATRAYHFRQKHPKFTTHQHGEERAFVDSSPYDKVMPLPINTMALIKAVLAEDYEKAEQLGLLEVDPEDFALPAFVCPSKIEMVEIIKKGQEAYSKQYFE